MKQFKIMKAYETIESLKDNTSLPKDTLWALYKLRMALRPHVEFQREMEEKIRNKYESFVDENGMLHNDKAKEYVAEINELNDMDKEVDAKCEIRLNDNLGISLGMMETLEGFVDFLPPEN